jgi:beta-glucosidase
MKANKESISSQQNFLFPEGFLWGAATSHFQVEGNPFEINNRLSDWSLWTQDPTRIADQTNADTASDFFQRYADDIDLLTTLNLNSFRLSLNWAAICPGPATSENENVSKEMIAYYRRVLQTAKDKKIKTFVTLFHFCVPQWLAIEGGWENEKTAHEFARFAKIVAKELGDLVDFWQTLNEPLSYAYESYVNGLWPPGLRNEYVRCFLVIRNQLVGHAEAYKAIHDIDDSAQVSYALHWRSFMARNTSNPLDLFVAYCRNKIFNHLFPMAIQSGYLNCPFPLNLFKQLSSLAGPIPGLKDSADFLGINYYTREICEFSPHAPFIPLGIRSNIALMSVNALGWETYPAALLKLLTIETLPYTKNSKGQERPIYITENGYGSRFAANLTEGDWSLEDPDRCEYLYSHLLSIYKAIKAGINIKGYLHWSLLDNFEWAEGLQIRFGLVRVAYPSQERTPRDSAHLYSKIASSNSLIDYEA